MEDCSQPVVQVVDTTTSFWFSTQHETSLSLAGTFVFRSIPGHTAGCTPPIHTEVGFAVKIYTADKTKHLIKVIRHNNYVKAIAISPSDILFAKNSALCTSNFAASFGLCLPSGPETESGRLWCGNVCLSCSEGSWLSWDCFSLNAYSKINWFQFADIGNC